jgi:2-iminobutanoate/2-iminopropanoate deaminase
MNLSKKRIESKHAPRPIGPYSQAVIAGSFLFASGQIPVDPETSEMVTGPIEAQTEQVLKNLLAVLKEAKLGPQNVVKATVYLTDLGDFSGMNTVYERYLGKEAPARSTIQVAGLPRGANVEIEIVAAF